jgi:SAM-dependent methyltransferase
VRCSSSCRLWANSGHSDWQHLSAYRYSLLPGSNHILDDFKAFRDLEREGWSDPGRASRYVALFASASDQAIGSLLDAVNAKPGLKALDLCCGQGNVSEALVGHDCDVVGIDFSPAMLAFAHARVPKAEFIGGDAQDMPFDDEEFDLVVSNLGYRIMSALGQKQTPALQQPMSALPLIATAKADIQRLAHPFTRPLISHCLLRLPPTNYLRSSQRRNRCRLGGCRHAHALHRPLRA